MCLEALFYSKFPVPCIYVHNIYYRASVRMCLELEECNEVFRLQKSTFWWLVTDTWMSQGIPEYVVAVPTNGQHVGIQIFLSMTQVASSVNILPVCLRFILIHVVEVQDLSLTEVTEAHLFP